MGALVWERHSLNPPPFCSPQPLFSCPFQELWGQGPPPMPPATPETPRGAWLVGVSQHGAGKEEGANWKMRLFQGIDSVTGMGQRGWGLQRGRGEDPHGGGCVGGNGESSAHLDVGNSPCSSTLRDSRLWPWGLRCWRGEQQGKQEPSAQSSPGLGGYAHSQVLALSRGPLICL